MGEESWTAEIVRKISFENNSFRNDFESTGRSEVVERELTRQASKGLF